MTILLLCNCCNSSSWSCFSTGKWEQVGRLDLKWAMVGMVWEWIGGILSHSHIIYIKKNELVCIIIRGLNYGIHESSESPHCLGRTETFEIECHILCIVFFSRESNSGFDGLFIYFFQEVYDSSELRNSDWWRECVNLWCEVFERSEILLWLGIAVQC